MSGAGLAVVVTMCLALLAVIGTVCYLAVVGTETPEVLDRVLQGLLIGVPALLAKTYRDSKQDTTQQVEVVNPPDMPVPTEEAPVSTDVLGEPSPSSSRRR